MMGKVACPPGLGDVVLVIRALILMVVVLIYFDFILGRAFRKIGRVVVVSILMTFFIKVA